jgi:hypothetical protein
VVVRDLQQLGSLTGNNFFLFAFLLVVFQPESGAFFGIVMGLLLFFPLTTDPLAKIPADRLLLWPFSPRDRLVLRAVSVWLSPIPWVTLGVLLYTAKVSVALAFLGAAILFYALGALFSRIRIAPAWRPPLMGGLAGKNLREMLTVLDPYAALLLTISGTLYRFFGSHVDPDAFMMLALLVVLAMSTYALCLFGLDTDSSFTRYHLLPLRGWRILLSKDIGYLVVVTILVLPLAPLCGFAAALMALAVGHKSSVEQPIPQNRWRFTGGANISVGICQVFLMFSAGTMVGRTSKLVLLPCVAIYAASLWWYGRRLERMEE